MGLFEDLKQLDVDVDGGLKRIGGNEGLYKRLLNTFVKAMKAQQISPDFNTSDYEDVKEKAHAIKGTSGNLSITPVFEAYSQIMDLLRAEKPEEANEVLKKIIPVQDEIIACIEKYAE
uniref:HPt domain-containing protein n=1 Tax=Eubacterium plexicaudatum ASF492 TaxID=1235802 RepID=N2BHI6_9FIRM